MMGQVACPSCRETIQFHEAALGQILRCPRCQKAFGTQAPPPPSSLRGPGERLQANPPSPFPRTHPPLQAPGVSHPPGLEARPGNRKYLLWAVGLAGGVLVLALAIVGGWWLFAPRGSETDTKADASGTGQEDRRGEGAKGPAEKEQGPQEPGGRGPRRAAPPHNAPALRKGDREEIYLGRVAKVAVGRGGGHLVLHLPEQKKLAVFDVFRGKVAEDIPLAGEVVRFAAGAKHLVVLYPNAKLLQVWSLEDFKKERSAPFPDALTRDDIHQVCMGSASRG